MRGFDFLTYVRCVRGLVGSLLPERVLELGQVHAEFADDASNLASQMRHECQVSMKPTISTTKRGAWSGYATCKHSRRRG
jgi:hypothetical protein